MWMKRSDSERWEKRHLTWRMEIQSIWELLNKPETMGSVPSKHWAKSLPILEFSLQQKCKLNLSIRWRCSERKVFKSFVFHEPFSEKALEGGHAQNGGINSKRERQWVSGDGWLAEEERTQLSGWLWKGIPQTSKSDLRSLDRKLGMFAHICNSGETEAGRVPLQDQFDYIVQFHHKQNQRCSIRQD